jgi:Tol biopolymer transport system component
MGSLLRLSIAACGLLALLAISASAQAAFRGKNGKIAFVTDRDDNFVCSPDPEDCAHDRMHHVVNTEIYTVNPDGTGENRLTHSGVPDGVPAWSPDGSKIAFARFFGDLHADDRWDAFTMNADGSGETNIARTLGVDFSYDPAWSPDGRKIALSLYDYGVPNGIYIANSDGTERTFLTAGAEPAWSPDGTKIAFNGPGGLYVMNADGTGQTKLTDNGGGPDWSPDGTKIAFNGPGGLYVLNADGTGQTKLTANAAFDGPPAWSPDGTKIAFASNRDDIYSAEIYTMNADGTGQTRLTNNPDGDFAPNWQPIPGPKRSDYKNAAQFCKAEQAFWGDQFASRYAGGPNAYGKCVSRNK